MKITNHKLDDCWYGPSPNVSGTLANPTLLVIHFTASGGADGKGDVTYFRTKAAKASAHVVLGRDGKVMQVVPFNKKAWHAGRSIWRGVPNCNDYSIGIEVDNWGKLVKTADGKLRSWTKQEVPASSAALLTHKHEKTPYYWELYNEEQMQALKELVQTIIAKYPSIKEVVGHEDIAPGRKTDPGPAMDMSSLRSAANGRADRPNPKRKAISNLNVRGGPGLEFAVNRVLTKGSEVEVIYDKPGEWAQIDTGEWVNDNYLSAET